MVGLAVVGFSAVIVVSAVLNGWVLSIMWGWFFVPVLGLPSLSVVQAIGIAMVISYLTSHRDPESNSNEDAGEKFGKAVAHAIFYPLFTLFVAWIVHLFM